VSSFFDLSQGLGAFICGAVAALAGNRGAFATGVVTALLGLALLRTVKQPSPAAAPVHLEEHEQISHE
jgi:hypothetical protein